jgi:hypothetical protein
MSGRDDFRATRLRPYAVTGGRTRGGVDLAVESIVRTTTRGARRADDLDRDRQRILRLALEPLSLAEVSAHLGLHLQAVRVLVGDLVVDGLVETTANPTASGDRADLRLLERVLDGLQSL